MRLGVTIAFEDQPLHLQRRRLESLVDLGYTDVWSSEVDAIDAVTSLAMAAAWAPQLRLGTAIIPAYTRGPAVIAQTAAALCEAGTGGFVCGIGSSSPAVVERWNAASLDRPLERTRDLVRFLKRVLAGEKVSEQYETFAVDGFRLARPPQSPPPVLVAGLRPRMLELAAVEADGAIVNFFSPDDVRQAAKIVGSGEGERELVARFIVAPTDDREAVYGVMKRLIAAYLSVPAYAKSQEWLGRGDKLRAMWEAWNSGDRREAVAHVSDEVVDELIIHGSPERCRERIAEYVDAGVTTPVLALLPMQFDIDEALRLLSPAAGRNI